MELIAAGQLPPDHKKIAKLAGVSVSAFGMWERGETWPKDSRREKLATLMQWSVEELDGRQVTATTVPGDEDDMSFPVSPDEVELLALYRGLALEERIAERKRLAGILHARHATQRHVRAPLRPVTDTEVEDKAPITKTLREKKMPAPKKQKPADE